MEKERLPDERTGVTHRFRITDKNNKITAGYIQTGTHPDGRLGEIFIRAGKPGHEMAWLDQFAICFSVALQSGVTLESLCSKFQNSQFEPCGSTSNPDIKRCTSLLDYLARFLLLKYGKAEG